MKEKKPHEPRYSSKTVQTLQMEGKRSLGSVRQGLGTTKHYSISAIAVCSIKAETVSFPPEFTSLSTIHIELVCFSR
jgi:hypothetical protein